MWPLTLAFPRTPEAYIVSFCDKIISTREILKMIAGRLKPLKESA